MCCLRRNDRQLKGDEPGSHSEIIPETREEDSVHEWALAEGVIETALGAAKEQECAVITRINIKMGQLQQIDKEIFEYALREIIQARGSVAAGAKIDIEDEEAVLKCRNCGHEWGFESALKILSEGEKESIHFVPEIAHVYMTCPACKSPDFEFVKGRGVWLESIEGAQE